MINILDISLLDSYVLGLADQVDGKDHKQFFLSNVRNCLVKSYIDTREVESTPGDLPDWASRVIEGGDPLHSFDVSKSTDGKLSHIIDWFKSMEDDGDTDLVSAFDKNISRMTVRDALKRADEYFAIKNSKVAKPSLEDEDRKNVTTVIKFRDGHRIVSLDNNKALKLEGARMHNCLAGRKIESSTHYYSLRDSNNKPKMSMFTSKRQLVEAKEVNNNPVDSCSKYLVRFMNEMKIMASKDGTPSIVFDKMTCRWKVKKPQSWTYDSGRLVIDKKEVLIYSKERDLLFIVSRSYSSILCDEKDMTKENVLAIKGVLTSGFKHIYDRGFVSLRMKEALLSFGLKKIKDRVVPLTESKEVKTKNGRWIHEPNFYWTFMESSVDIPIMMCNIDDGRAFFYDVDSTIDSCFPKLYKIMVKYIDDINDLLAHTGSKISRSDPAARYFTIDQEGKVSAKDPTIGRSVFYEPKTLVTKNEVILGDGLRWVGRAGSYSLMDQMDNILAKVRVNKNGYSFSRSKFNRHRPQTFFKHVSELMNRLK